MKKIYIVGCIFLFVIIFVCVFTLKKVPNGTYYMETDPPMAFSPMVVINDNHMYFMYDLLSSNNNRGTYTIEGDVLTMTVGEQTFVFKIEWRTLVFQKELSSEIISGRDLPIFEVKDGTRFVFRHK